MVTKFIEACDGGDFNWGKFAVMQFTLEEWQYKSVVDNRSLIGGRGWCQQHLFILDLQTGEGAIFRVHPTGLAKSDLDKHKIWVCPMYEHLLAWLYKQDVSDLGKLPALVNLGDVPISMHGYRRTGA